MPVASSDRPKWLIPALVFGGILVLAVVVLGVIVVVRMGGDEEKSEKKQPAVAQNVPPAAGQGGAGMTAGMTPAGGGAAAMQPGTEGSEEGAAREGDTAAMKGDSGEEADTREARGSASARDSRGSSRASSRRRRRRRSSSRSRASRTSSRSSGGSSWARASRPSTRSRPRSRGGGDDPLEALLGNAARKGRPRAARSRQRAPARPSKASLSRSDISRSIGRVKGSVRRCYDKYKVPGLVWVRVTVKGSSGRVASASVKGKFSGTPTGRCVARSVRRAKFPKFSKTRQSFRYPFRLR
jgi:hypothetical protein